MATTNIPTDATFSFELVSPERRLISEPARMVTIPGQEGDFGVLAGHMSLVATIRPGVVEVVPANGNEVRRIFIAGGFADVSANNCTILAEEAINVADLNQADLDQTVRNLREDLGLATDEIEKARVRHRLEQALAKLEAVSGQISNR